MTATPQARPTSTRTKTYLPILQWLPTYDRSWLRFDVIAGLTIMALLVPEGMAYAQLAGVPPQTAFYAAPIGLILYAIFGTSRQLVVAVSSAVAVMSASVVGELAPDGTEAFIALTAALAVLTGVITLAAGMLRLGRIAQFFSESVLLGFVSGLALVIMIKQVPKLLGLESGHGNFWERVIELVRQLPESHGTTVAVGVACLLLMIFLERRYERIPAAIVVLVFGIAVVSLLDLDARGVHIVGEIPAGLAPPKLPDVSAQQLLMLLPGALALTLVLFSEAIGPDRQFARKHRYEIDEDQELVGLGMANIGAGLFQGFSIGASLSKSASSDAMGGKTQMAGVVAAIATVLVALFLTPLFFNLPEAALAAIVIVAVSRMFKPREFRRLYHLRRADFWLAAIAFLGVLTADEVVVGLLVAVAVSLLALVWRASSARISVLGRVPRRIEFRSVRGHPDYIQVRGLLMVRPEEGLFFANASSIQHKIRAHAGPSDDPLREVLLDLELSNDLDVPSCEMLSDLHEELSGRGIGLTLAGLNDDVRDRLQRSGVTEEIGADRYYPTVPHAVLAYIQAHAESVDVNVLETLLDKIDLLGGLLSSASEDLDEEDQARLNEAVTRLDEIQSHVVALQESQVDTVDKEDADE